MSAATDNLDKLYNLVESSVRSRRHLFVHAIAKAIYAQLSENNITTENAPWIAIASLSQLRKIVGGRFENLKQRWVDAGFPLRTKKGDRSSKASLNKDGWEELYAWMLTQGFEAKLADTAKGCLFEVRKIKSFQD